MSESVELANETPATRSATEIYLVGQPSCSIGGSKLPTTKQVLRFLFSALQNSSDRKTAFKDTVDNVISFWNMARIKTMTAKYCQTKLQALWEEWRNLQKSKGKSASQTVERFREKLEKLWDIGATDAIECIQKNSLLTAENKEEDVAFYLDQRDDRKATMCGNDKLFAKKKKQQEERQKRKRPRTQMTDDYTEHGVRNPPDTDDFSQDSEETEEASSDVEMEVHQSTLARRRSRKEVDLSLPQRILHAPAVVEAADRFQLSSSQLTGIIGAVLRSANPPADLADFSLSKSTARRSRIARRSVVADDVKASFEPPAYGVVHWDGKTITNHHGNREHRQAILISGSGYEEGKLLAVPAVEDGRGLTQAHATIHALEEWECSECVIGLFRYDVIEYRPNAGSGHAP